MNSINKFLDIIHDALHSFMYQKYNSTFLIFWIGVFMYYIYNIIMYGFDSFSMVDKVSMSLTVIWIWRHYQALIEKNDKNQTL